MMIRYDDEAFIILQMEKEVSEKLSGFYRKRYLTVAYYPNSGLLTEEYVKHLTIDAKKLVKFSAYHSIKDSLCHNYALESCTLPIITTVIQLCHSLFQDPAIGLEVEIILCILWLSSKLSLYDYFIKLL
jgi:hypothetical protein